MSTRTEDLEMLATLVRQMRARQRAYFAQKRPADLSASRELEKQVDELLRRLTGEQRSLFDE